MPTAEEIAKAKAINNMPEATEGEGEGETTEPAKANDNNTTKSKKHDVPAGWLSAVDFGKHWTKVLQERGELAADEVIRPQYIYGYIRNTKGFPFKNHTDQRFIVPVEDATKFLLERRTANANKKAEKAAAAAAAAATAAAQPATVTPEPVAAESTS